MKTKQIFIAIISLILLISCSTDDSVFNTETNNQTLESTNASLLISIDDEGNGVIDIGDKDNTENDCDYSSINAYYSIFGSMTSSKLQYIYSKRNNFISKNDTTGDCPKYSIPTNLTLYYDSLRGYYEIWEAHLVVGCRGTGNSAPCPLGDKDEIEL